MKIYATSWLTGEMQIEEKIRYCYLIIRIVKKYNKTDNNKC